MKFINDITRETLIICHQSTKEYILNMHLLKPIKFMNIKEFFSNYFFSYDERTIRYVSINYHVKYDIAKEYIDNLYYLEDKEYSDSKLQFLSKLKADLINQSLLTYNPYFKEYLSNIDIIIYDLEIDAFFLNILKPYHYQIIHRVYHNYPHKVFKFHTMEEEVSYIAHKIASLIDEGIDINNIKLTNVDESYYNTLNRIFSLHNLKINIPYKTKLNSYPLVKQFLEGYKDNKPIDLILEEIQEDTSIYQELVRVINKYLIYEDKDLLIYMLNNTSISSPQYQKAISIIDYLDYLSNDNEYIFLLGFNEGIIPKNYLDTDYLSDNLKKELLLSDTYTLNNNQKIRIINNLKDIKNLTITYKEEDYKKNYYPSPLISSFEVGEDTYDLTISYSEVFDKIRLVKYYDEYFKYGSKAPNFDLFNNNYHLKYNSYNNKFTGINRELTKLNLSYSKLNIYHKCAFKYYLDDVLKLNIFEENFSTIIGSMVHYIMEKCLSNHDYDSDKYFNEFIQDKEFTKKERFFLDKYKIAVQEFVNWVNSEGTYSSFNQAMYEKKIDIDYGNNIHFSGIIDKILYLEDNNKTYMTLIDYKTGSDNIDLKYFKDGIDIQLPIYLYLSSKLGFNNIVYPGFYLQHFNLNNKDYRLEGYSNSNPDTLRIIDDNYENSKIIKGLKTISDGSFSKTSRLLSDEQINTIKDKTEDIIKTTIEDIKDNKFSINPKMSDRLNSCQYCQYQDICFKKHHDEVVIEPHDLEEVL